jgi:septal ring factor EnvC (AmiA/AmiB activator)
MGWISRDETGEGGTMLRRVLCLAAVLLLAMVLAGCFVTQSTYVKKEEEATALAKTVADLEQKNKDAAALNGKLQAENTDLKKEAAAKDEQLKKLSEDVARRESRQSEMAGEMDRLKVQLAKSKEATIEESPAAKKQTGLKSIRLKVLTGDGKMESARRMAKRISSMGYRVEGVGKAQSADYPANTVYFTPKYKNEAKALAKRIGKETILKPLTWKSVFNIIVVTGG